jgi:hypothetical protein
MRRTRLILIGLAVLLTIGGLIFLPCLFATTDNEGWVRPAHSLQNIGWAMSNYQGLHGSLPPAVVRDSDGRALYSWRVLLLPFLGESTLFEQFRFDEPWDSPHNRPLSSETPRCYLPALGGYDDPPGRTRFQVFVGPGTAFERDGITWHDFPDRGSHTILVVEASDPVVWSEPVDLMYDAGKPLPSLGGVFTKPVTLGCYTLREKPGFVACFADCSVHFIRATTDDRIVRSLITRNGSEAFDISQLD